MKNSEDITEWKQVPEELWNDWRWQLKNRITTTEELQKFIPLTPDEKSEIDQCLKKFRMAITPYYASLIDIHNPNCPIRLQCIPRIQELYIDPEELADPLGEERDSPVENIVHRYPDRVLFLLTKKCSTYCRHCTRRRLVGEEDYSISHSSLERALAYIRSNPKIRDVLISGGDPLILPDEYLENIISRLRQIKHVEIIRIGTRVPVVLPMRITERLLNMLKKYHPIWINTHFNHPAELTAASIKACTMIADAGIPLGNQSVLLRGVNDNAEILKQLFTGLLKARVRPYYLYQCDVAQGIGHFRTPVEDGIAIMKKIRGYISGLAVPTYVIDAPMGGGKIPIYPEYIVSMDENKVILRNYQDKIYEYPNVKKSLKKAE